MLVNAINAQSTYVIPGVHIKQIIAKKTYKSCTLYKMSAEREGELSIDIHPCMYVAMHACSNS
jgi:hypothetical protein